MQISVGYSGHRYMAQWLEQLTADQQWFNSGWRSWFTFMSWSSNQIIQMINIMSPITTSIRTITRMSAKKKCFCFSCKKKVIVKVTEKKKMREDTEQNVRTRQSTQRRGRRTTRHHNAAQLSTARVGALRPMPHCLGIGSTRVGPGRTPTVHTC